MTKREMLELLCVRDSSALCDNLIQSIMRLEGVTNNRLNDCISLPLDRLLRTLRSREAELIDKMAFDPKAER